MTREDAIQIRSMFTRMQVAAVDVFRADSALKEAEHVLNRYIQDRVSEEEKKAGK